MRNKILCCTFWVAMVGFNGPTFSQPVDLTVPEFLAGGPEHPTQSAPWWVSTDALVGPSGTVNWSLLAPEAQEIVQALTGSMDDSPAADPWSRMKRPGCDAVSIAGEAIRIDHRPNGTIEDLTEQADWIVLAEVVHWRQGFLGGHPTSLYALRPVEILKAPAEGPTAAREVDRFFLFFPFAQIPVAEGTICRVDDRFPNHPVAGSRVLVFSYPGSFWSEGRSLYLRPNDPELFFTQSDGTVSVPRHYGQLDELEQLDLEFFVSRVKSALRELRGDRQ